VANDIDSVRLDKWLWAARFFKTRQLASEAITGGKVHVNGQRAKPSKDVKVNTEIEIHKNGYSWEITVLVLTVQRRSAKEAALLYAEKPTSQAKRQQQIQDLREQKELFNFSGLSRRPNKKERRLIHRFKQQ
jgi:ribosome-associated heat shock protein Hsp15